MRTIKGVDVKNKIIFVRVDFNVPLKKGRILDDERIKAALPTIKYLLKKKAGIILASHLGRPDGKIVEEFRLRPVAQRLAILLKKPVKYVDGFSAGKVNAGEIVVLENLRFDSGEEKDDKVFAKRLASQADIFVNDAFGVSHRAHASVHAITKFLPSYAGFLIEKEVKALSSLLSKPKRPVVAVLGGAKVSSKIGVIENLMKKVDVILIGGAMMFTFYKALGWEVGKSKFEPDKVSFAKSLLKKSKRKIILPVDVVLSDKKVVSSRKIPVKSSGFDIGPETCSVYSEIIKEAKTVFWNGPLGFFEQKPFDKGTLVIAKAIADCKGITVVGGGDSVEAVKKMRLTSKFTHVSTGGGASLEFVEGKKLPGLIPLM